MSNKLPTKNWLLFLGIELALVILILTGRLPLAFSYLLAGYLATAMMALSFRAALALFLASIPLFLAIPLPGAPSFSSWRILTLLLLVRFLWERRKRMNIANWRLRVVKRLPVEIIAGGILVVIGLGLSFLAPAVDLIAAFKRAIFVSSAALIAVMVGGVTRQGIEQGRELIFSLALGTMLVMTGALLQYLFAVIAPLFTFWQWWAVHISQPFYGEDLAGLLKVSNTWFSYYKEALPTLRLFSVFPDSHSFALFGVLSVTVLSGWYYMRSNDRMAVGRYFIRTMLLIDLLFVIMSGSRGIWVAGLAAVFAASVVLILLSRRGRFLWFSLQDQHWVRGAGTPFLLFLPLFLGAALLTPLTQDSSFLKRISTDSGKRETLVFERFSSVRDFNEVSNQGRFAIWQESLKAIAVNPLTGVGWGNFPRVLALDPSASKIGASAHNLYLDVAVETGILGLAAVLFFLTTVFWRNIRALRRHRAYPLWVKVFFLTFSFSFIWTAVYGLFDVVLLNDKVLLLFMALVGLQYGLNTAGPAPARMES